MTHVYKFRAGSETARAPLILLHGSDGTESDLMPLADELAPGATQLAVRGTVATEGGYAYFRRFPDRRVDEDDVAARLPVLADFIETSCAAHNLTKQPVAVGFSNGAIMAAALLMTHPQLLAGAILFRPLSPFTHDLPPPTERDAGPHDRRYERQPQIIRGWSAAVRTVASRRGGGGPSCAAGGSCDHRRGPCGCPRMASGATALIARRRLRGRRRHCRRGCARIPGRPARSAATGPPGPAGSGRCRTSR